MALYCMGVMCSKPGGGTSQYLHPLFFLLLFGEWLEGQLRWALVPQHGRARPRPADTHLRLLCSLEELRRSRLLRSRLRLRRFSPRQAGDPLRLRLLCLSLSRSAWAQGLTLLTVRVRAEDPGV